MSSKSTNSKRLCVKPFHPSGIPGCPFCAQPASSLLQKQSPRAQQELGGWLWRGQAVEGLQQLDTALWEPPPLCC